MRAGPTKLIFIHSGRFKYAEVELFNSIQLVGANNAGKTSLAAALQFLFINDEQQMHFSKNIEETRRYYFPVEYSWILFQCMTKHGPYMVGAHGLGPLQQYRFERIIFQGDFAKSDFLDESNRSRSTREVLGRLVDRGITTLKQTEFQAALTGYGDSRGISLELVPLRQRGTYEQFRQIFRNLHRFKHIHQRELKELLVDVYQLDDRNLDLTTQFRSIYQSAQRENDQVVRFKKCQRSALEAITTAERIKLLKGGLPRLWSLIITTYNFVRNELNIALERHEIRATSIKTERDVLREKSSLNVAERDAALKQSFSTKHKIDQIDEGHTKFRNFDKDEAERKIEVLNREYNDLAYRIEHAVRVDQQELNEVIGSLIRRLQHFRTMRQRLPDLVAVRLQEELTAEEIRNIFTVLNPLFLDFSLVKTDDNSDQILVKDHIQLIRGLKDIAEKIRKDRYVDALVEFDTGNLPLPDLANYCISYFDDVINKTKGELDKSNLILADKLNLESLIDERDALRVQIATASEVVKSFDQWTEAISSETILRIQYNSLTKLINELSETGRIIQARQEEIREEALRIESSVKEITISRDLLSSRMYELIPPDDQLPLTEEPVRESPQAALEHMINQYRKEFDELKTIEKRCEELLLFVAQETYGEYSVDDEDSINRLRKSLDELPTREDAATQLWNHLMGNIKAALKSLVGGLDTLAANIAELNALIGRYSISNLGSIKLVLRERSEIVSDLRAIVEAETEPLFARPEEAKKALERIRSLLERYPRLRLVDLFEISFRVIGAEGRERLYEELGKIESNGTTLTIKVVVNLMLLSSIVSPGGARIPFYLDEVDSVDDDNLDAILSLARQLGFIAVLASPKPRDNVDAVYFLNAIKGSVTLTPEFSQVRVHPRPTRLDGGVGGDDADA